MVKVAKMNLVSKNCLNFDVQTSNYIVKARK